MSSVELLLEQWGFPKNVLDVFKENDVDLQALQLLDDVQINMLILVIRPQANFKKALSNWKVSPEKSREILQREEVIDEIISKYGDAMEGLSSSLTSPTYEQSARSPQHNVFPHHQAPHHDQCLRAPATVADTYYLLLTPTQYLIFWNSTGMVMREANNTRLCWFTMPSPDYSVELELGDPSSELQEYARVHCGEDPNTRLQAIYELRSMVYERGECTPHRMDDEFLVRFLRARGFIPQRAHRLMVNYYKFKEENPVLFENVYPLDLRKIGDANVIAVPPYRDQEGRRLLIYRIGCWNPKAIAIDDLFKGTVMALELGLLEQRTQILGGVALFDLEHIGTQHALRITPNVAAKIVKLLVSSFPASTHAIHVINHSWVFDKIYVIFKPLLNSEMRSKVFFHGRDVTSLHKHIHPEHLPQRYGGIWPDYPYTIWLESLRKNFSVAKELISFGYRFREEELCPDVVRQLKEQGIKLS